MQAKVGAVVTEMCKQLAAERNIKNRSDYTGSIAPRLPTLAPGSSAKDQKKLTDDYDKLIKIFRQILVKVISKLLDNVGLDADFIQQLRKETTAAMGTITAAVEEK